jgi:hypothetical protein
MAVTITHDFATLFNANTAFGGGTVYSGFQRFGTGCNGSQVSNTTTHFTGTVTSFNGTGKRITVWMTAPASVASLANGGYRIVIGSSTGVRAYYVGGNDVAPFVQSGWFCFVLDLGALADYSFAQISGGAPDVSAITTVGVGFNNTAKATGNSPNVFWDIMQVGTGLTVAGGTAGDPGVFSEIAAWDETSTAATGTIRQIGDGVFGLQCNLTFGATAAASHFEDTNALVFFEGGVGNNPDFFKLTAQGSASHVNVFRLGERLGSGESSIGVAGVTLQSSRPWQLIADSADSTIELFGSTVRGATQGVSLRGEVRSCVFDANGQINPNNALVRLSSFSGYTGTNGAMLWNADINVQQCSFNGNNRAVEHTATGTFSYSDLTFSGNTHDIHNSSGGTLVVNAVGTSNPATFVNSAGGSTAIQNTKQFSFTVRDQGGNTLTGFEWRVYEKDPAQGIIGAEIYGEEVASASTINIQYNYTGDIVAMIQIIDTGYEEFLGEYLFGDVDQSTNITLTTDLNI